jgi:hypothetical protein
MSDLEQKIDEAEWAWLEPHLKRNAVILVAVDLELAEVASTVAADDKARVAEWIQSGKLAKPSAQQVEAWSQVPAKKFLSVVVQPYVLVQEFSIH